MLLLVCFLACGFLQLILQTNLFMFLPILFTFLLARFPAGLVIYWAWNNLLSIIQQKVIMYKMGVK